MSRSALGRPPVEVAGAALRDRGDGVPSLLGDVDLHLFNEGNHSRLYEKLGAHVGTFGGHAGTYFGVWAPEATKVDVLGDWNGRRGATQLTRRGYSGIWEGFVPGAGKGHTYVYLVGSRHGGETLTKADPFGLRQEEPPRTGSMIWDEGERGLGVHEWNDAAWMSARAAKAAYDAPMSIYEVHLGSWRRKPEEGDRKLGYREIAPLLAEYAERHGFSHVELLPVMEHPFYGSWGYQVTGFFAPSARYGTPEDLMFLVDTLHQRGIGVIFDWVPSHFPTDAHGPYRFDGSHLYEHADPQQGIHPHWTSAIFNYGRHEVRSFLLSSAAIWLDRYHADGLRVDGVASMLYLDYGRNHGEWRPNKYGGKENLEAVSFLQALNVTVEREFPDAVTIAEESTAWPGVTREVHLGGLGFDYKWDLGWSHDTLAYFARDPVHRNFHHGELTFRPMYATSERFVLALSHDECVHGKGSLLGKMAGDEWQKRANLRSLFAYMFATPGKKLLFQGSEIGQWREWAHERSLDWHLLDDGGHAGLALLVGELNRLYREQPGLHSGDHDGRGFSWIVANDSGHSVVAFERAAIGGAGGSSVIFVMNATAVPRHNYRIGVPRAGWWREAINTDAAQFGGSGMGNLGGMEATPVAAHGRGFSLNVTLPPLAALFFVLD
jgi:1,4-alpha-glucan branching enzyme